MNGTVVFLDSGDVVAAPCDDVLFDLCCAMTDSGKNIPHFDRKKRVVYCSRLEMISKDVFRCFVDHINKLDVSYTLECSKKELEKYNDIIWIENSTKPLGCLWKVFALFQGKT